MYFGYWVIFFNLLLSSIFFFKINNFVIFFQVCHQNVKQFGSRLGMTVLGSDLYLNCMGESFQDYS